MPPKPAVAAGGPPKTPSAPAAATPNVVKEEKPEQETLVNDETLIKQGIFSFPDGAKYSGEYRVLTTQGQPEVVRHGRGIYSNGPERYDGQWENDRMNGQGTYYFATGAVYEVSEVDKATVSIDSRLCF